MKLPIQLDRYTLVEPIGAPQVLEREPRREPTRPVQRGGEPVGDELDDASVGGRIGHAVATPLVADQGSQGAPILGPGLSLELQVL